MKGSKIAKEIEADMRREQYYKNKVIRNKCIMNKEKQCNICRYKDICDNSK